VLPLIDELSCRYAKFIANALAIATACTVVVSYAARHSVYFIGCRRRLVEMHISAARDGVLLNHIAFITKDLVRSYVQHAQSLDIILTVCCLLELLYVRHGYSSLSYVDT